mgnify:FL=1
MISEKVFLAVQNSIDELLEKEENIIQLNNKIASIDDRNKKVDNMLKKIDELKKELLVTFMRTQNLIISSYFDKEFDKITNLENLEIYRRKLYHFKDYIGLTEGYTFFNDYYINKMDQLEHKYNVLENGGVETALKVTTKKENKLILFFKFLKKLVLGKSSQDETEQNFK